MAGLRHSERHFVRRIGWLRPAVLGANDGIVSTASLVVGVASASGDRHAVLVAGLAGLVAGALSMAAGEYVSVSSQADTEAASLKREREELAADRGAEERELAELYVRRGLDGGLAAEVARQMMAKDALEAHARDELGILELTAARPVQAALFSAASFSAGAVTPVLLAALAPAAFLAPITALVSLVLLAALGLLGAAAGGAPPLRAIARVVFWGILAMLATSLVGKAFGVIA